MKEENSDTRNILTYFEGHGFSAIKIHPLMDSYPADSRAVDPVAEAARELGVPLFVHSGHPPFSLPCQIARLANKHPDTYFVMIHMGHGHGVYIDSAIKAAMEEENIYLETSGMPMHTKIKEAFEKIDPTRILFGTDTPFHHPSVELQKTKVAELTSQQKELYYKRNAESLPDI